MAGGVHGAAGADAEATATGREGEGATIPGRGRGASIAGAPIPKKEDVAIPCAKAVWITRMALRLGENAVKAEIHALRDKQIVIVIEAV